VGLRLRDKGIKRKEVGKSGVKNGGKRRREVIRGVRKKVRVRG